MKDIDRTFPQRKYFQVEHCGDVGIQTLGRLLQKFASEHPDIGYCQGMNFIAGFLLLISGGSELQSFFFMELLTFKYKIDGFFKDGFPELKVRVAIFNKLFK
mmetsp:Transcript_15655/g.2602  ORF Transcript_15655/g.2602 Transcript_15655/m.2602 type:complete len:102 (+) Transcript_15655:393-698(+)